MRYALVPEHHHYYEANGSIFFEELISPFSLPEEEGRDLWRSHPDLYPVIRSKKLAEIAADLTRVRHLRLLYDQRITGLEGATVEEISAFQGVVGGWHLKLSGSGTFFSKTAPLNLGPGLLIVYGISDAVYTRNPKDPYRVAIQDLGYNYGDRLKEETHPLVLQQCSR